MKTILVVLALFVAIPSFAKDKIISKESSKSLIAFWKPAGVNSVKVRDAIREILNVKNVVAVKLSFVGTSITVSGILDNGGVLRYPIATIETGESGVDPGMCPPVCD